MPIEKPFTPPPRKPVSEYKTPSPAVVLFSELVNRDDSAYYQNAPVKRGALYSSIVGGNQAVTDTYPTLYFLRERKLGQSDQLVFWDWATVPDAEDSYNAAVDYVSNAVPYPAFTRVYTIRRDEYETDPTIAIGLPLTGLIGVTIINGGAGYTSATGTIDGTDVEIEFVVSNGSIISGIVTNEGSGVAVGNTIIISGDGSGATAIPIVQPISCVLTSQKKQELGEDDPLRNEFVRVLRTYETLPGPFIPSTRIDDDGKVVTINTRRNIAANITSAETLIAGQWCKTTKKGDDNFVGEESVECRAIPGNPMPSTRLDPDGVKVNIVTTLKDTTLITTAETLIAGVWTKTTKKAVSDLVAEEIVESRAIPGNPIPSTQVDKDGDSIDVVKTWKDTTTIVTDETVSGGVWTRTAKDELSDLVSVEVVTARVVPGTAIISTKIDKDGKKITDVRTLKEFSTITTSESISAGFWVKIEAEAVSDLVAWEVITTRQVPGNAIPSARVEGDHEISSQTSTLIDASTFTPVSTEVGGFIETLEQKEVSDLVSESIATVKAWLDTASYSIEIPNVIPESFRTRIPTRVESHVSAGTAVAPTLGTGEFERTQKQLTKLLKETRFTKLDAVVLPVTLVNQETTTRFGGGVINVTLTLNTHGSLTVDEGLRFLESKVTDLGNGLDVKISEELSVSAWSVLPSRLWDENMRLEYDETQQVVASGASEDAAPGGVFGWISEVKALDKWRSRKTNVSKGTPAYVDSSSALISYDWRPFKFPGYLYFTGVGYYVRAAHADLCQHKIRTWWIQSTNPPATPAVDEIIMDNPIINSLNNVATLTYAGEVLHDDLITFATFFYPATTPSATEYHFGIPDGTTTLQGYVSLSAPGTGFTVGNILTFSGGGNSVTVRVESVGVSNSVLTFTVLSSTFAASGGPYSASGGSGSGAAFNVTVVYAPNYIPGTAWIGSERVINAKVEPEREKNVWKVQTRSVIMR